MLMILVNFFLMCFMRCATFFSGMFNMIKIAAIFFVIVVFFWQFPFLCFDMHSSVNFHLQIANFETSPK